MAPTLACPLPDTSELRVLSQVPSPHLLPSPPQGLRKGTPGPQRQRGAGSRTLCPARGCRTGTFHCRGACPDPSPCLAVFCSVGAELEHSQYTGIISKTHF